MAISGSYSDTPNKIKSEGQTITLKTVQLSENTIRVDWNIPEPMIGCDPDTLAYDGIVITVDNNPVQNETRPVDGRRYKGDPSASTDIHVGDKISTAKVVYAEYNDKSTNSFILNDVDPSKPLYVSGYAVDAQLRYHTEGVHAYSLPYGNKPGKEKPAKQEIFLGVHFDNSTFNIGQQISHVDGVSGDDETGLDSTKDYCFQLTVNDEKEPTQYVVSGADAFTYDDLVKAINLSIIEEGEYPSTPNLPNQGLIYFDGFRTFVFDGEKLIPHHTFITDTDPSSPTINDYWFDNDDELLYKWNGNDWENVPYYEYDGFINEEVTGGTILFNGTEVYVREGNVWCKRTVYFGDDPSSQFEPNSKWFWLDTATDILYRWDDVCEKWETVDAIVSNVDPHQLPSGYFWVNDQTNELFVRSVDSPKIWEAYSDRVEFSDTQPPGPTNGTVWINLETQQVEIFDGTVWNEIDNVIFFPTDPTNVKSCDIWIDTSSDPLKMFIWDSLNNEWEQITDFYVQPNDPTEEFLPNGTFWFDGDKLYVWDLVEWNIVEYVDYSGDPTNPQLNDIFYHTQEEKFYQWSGGKWNELLVFNNSESPTAPPSGSFWYQPSTNSLFNWNGMTWVSVTFVTESPVPAVGYVYFNTTDQKLYEWTGSEYIETKPKAFVYLNNDGNLVFETKLVGSFAYICVQHCSDGDLFRALSVRTSIGKPQLGTDPVNPVPTYDQLGIGTDGSPDERRWLIRQLELQLGAPLNVELTKDHYDTAIRLALEKFRQVSASAYQRGFQFLKIVPGEQHYLMTSKRFGYDKIVDITAAYRIQSSFLGNAAGQGAYGQAMIQHLYQMGSFDLISYHIISDYVELMNKMFAAYLNFTWNETHRMLSFHQTFGSNERILLDVTHERTEQEILKDRICKPWIERYALAQCMYMLAERRGKYATLPGAGGGVTLNAQDLRVRADQLLQECMDDIENFVANEIEKLGAGPSMVMG